MEATAERLWMMLQSSVTGEWLQEPQAEPTAHVPTLFLGSVVQTRAGEGIKTMRAVNTLILRRGADYPDREANSRTTEIRTYITVKTDRWDLVKVRETIHSNSALA